MAIPLSSAKDRSLTYSSSALPQMGGALGNWLLPMTFTIVTKTVVNSAVVETKEDIDFQGVWQPFTSRELLIKPEGERKWSWYWVHALPGVRLAPDMCVEYKGVQYRVMGKKNYEEYSYESYELIEDYTGSGPYDPAGS